MRGHGKVIERASDAGVATFAESVFPAADPQPMSISTSLELAVAAAKDAAAPFAATSPASRALLLEDIASCIEGLGDALLQQAHQETSLPLPRLQGERARTCAQLRMFAALIREGSWVDATIDSGDPDRKPAPKPDLRRMLVPLGPVAVFGASNFPLAFSVPGGDTVSALAAGCPVVHKAHPAHPLTCEMTGRVIVEAVQAAGMHPGVFSMIHGGADVGRALVLRDEIEAVGFTGSKAAGRSLFDHAASRPRPIPVFAEMGSVNPVVLLPGAARGRTEEIADGYAQSLVLGVGQFCTNPGVLLGVGSDFDDILADVAARLPKAVPGTMLTDQIGAKYFEGCTARAAHPALETLYAGCTSAEFAAPALFKTTAAEFVTTPELHEELFGPSAIAVKAKNVEELVCAAEAFEGQLTISVHFADEDQPLLERILPILTEKAGRIVANGFPTGVEVVPAMQHGGPYPATTDSRTTSVGTAAILRFARPVAYQNFPQQMLPEELRDDNPRGIWRTVGGELTKAPIQAAGR